MAEVVEHELMENVCNLKSYIKDTTELLRKLNKIPQPLPGNSIMFCLDVKALYPSVPRKEARIACEKALQKRQKPSIPTVCVLNMLDLVLENNHFGFNGKNYIQTEGTAIGSYLVMNYTCTYLEEWEQELFSKKVTAYLRITGDMLMMYGVCGNMD